jgi:hypothetical protein
MTDRRIGVCRREGKGKRQVRQHSYRFTISLYPSHGSRYAITSIITECGYAKSVMIVRIHAKFWTGYLRKSNSTKHHRYNTSNQETKSTDTYPVRLASKPARRPVKRITPTTQPILIPKIRFLRRLPPLVLLLHLPTEI